MFIQRLGEILMNLTNKHTVSTNFTRNSTSDGIENSIDLAQTTMNPNKQTEKVIINCKMLNYLYLKFMFLDSIPKKLVCLKIIFLIYNKH